MDAHSLDKLEFGRVRELLAEHCRCVLGRQLAVEILPARKQPMIRRWLRQTTEAMRLVEDVGLPPLAGVGDVRELVRRAASPTRLEAKDFASIGETLQATHAIRAWIDGSSVETPTLQSVFERIGDFKFIADQISRAIDPSGDVRDDASEKLSQIRQGIDKANDRIHVALERLLRSSHVTKMLQFPNATFHNDRIVLPLKSEHHGRLPGIVHRTSDTGATLFIEPAEVVELNNAIAKLRRDEHGEIGRILFNLARVVHANHEAILKAIDAIGVLDLVTAKVQMARAFEMTVPELNDQRRLLLRGARHPVLQALAREEEACGAQPRTIVPIDVRLGEDFDLLIVTGPNTGGKTVALKTVGLLTAMVHSGLPIPAAEGSSVPILDDVLIDVGDEQSLQQSLSTFSGHMSRILEILNRSTDRTLVLLDELGAGTDPDEGAAIGMAILDRLLDIACPAVVTTHLGMLKSVGFNRDRADNAAVEFDTETVSPTYRLLIGEPGQSNAITVAAHLGMPADLIEAARRHLPEQHKALTTAIESTAESRRKAEQARKEAETAKVAADQAEAEARAREQELACKRKEFEEWTQRVTHLKPGDRVKVLSFDRSGRVVRVSLAKERAEVDLGTNTVEVPLSDLHPEDAPAPPAKPDRPTPAPEAPKQPDQAAPAKRLDAKKRKTNGPVRKDTPDHRRAPAMPLEQILALQAGERVFVRRFRKAAQVVRIKPDKRRVVVDLGAMDAEVAFEEVCACSHRQAVGSNRTGRRSDRGNESKNECDPTEKPGKASEPEG